MDDAVPVRVEVVRSRKRLRQAWWARTVAANGEILWRTEMYRDKGWAVAVAATEAKAHGVELVVFA